jgi:hypothetical protein
VAGQASATVGTLVIEGSGGHDQVNLGRIGSPIDGHVELPLAGLDSVTGVVWFEPEVGLFHEFAEAWSVAELRDVEGQVAVGGEGRGEDAGGGGADVHSLSAHDDDGGAVFG